MTARWMLDAAEGLIDLSPMPYATLREYEARVRALAREYARIQSDPSEMDGAEGWALREWAAYWTEDPQ